MVDAERLALVGEALTLVPSTMPALRARLLVAGAQELITDSRSVQRRRTVAEDAVDLAAAQTDPAVRVEVFTHAAIALGGPDTLARGSPCSTPPSLRRETPSVPSWLSRQARGASASASKAAFSEPPASNWLSSLSWRSDYGAPVSACTSRRGTPRSRSWMVGWTTS